MCRVTLFALCLTIVVVHGYSVAKSRTKRSDLATMMLLAPFIKPDTNFMELTKVIQKIQDAKPSAKPSGPTCPKGTISKCVDPNQKAQANDEPMDFDDLEDKLADLEGTMDEVLKFLSKEKDTDKILKTKSSKVITKMEGKVKETDNVIDGLKKSVSDSLDDFQAQIREVNTSAQVTINSKGVIFYGRVGSPCSDELDNCLDENSQCRSGKCQCTPGYSFDMDDRSCKAKCDFYGMTYQTVHHYIIRGHNNLAMENVTSLMECKLECQETTDFTCRSIDYFPYYNMCFLSDKTFLDVPEEDCEYSSVGDYFQRDCTF